MADKSKSDSPIEAFSTRGHDPLRLTHYRMGLTGVLEPVIEKKEQKKSRTGGLVPVVEKKNKRKVEQEGSRL